MNPRALGALFENGETRPDYIALDLKLAPERYGELLPAGAGNRGVADSQGAAGNRGVAGGPVAGAGGPDIPDPAAALIASAALIRSSGIPHEYRSLALPDGRFGPGDIEALGPLVDNGPWHFRRFMPGTCLDPLWDGLDPPPRSLVRDLAEKARGLGKNGIPHEA
jgi:pyruvate formate lyase activating enzyme